MFCLKLGSFKFKKTLIYYTFNKPHLNSFILLVFPHVVIFRYVANFTSLTLSSFEVMNDTEVYLGEGCFILHHYFCNFGNFTNISITMICNV